MVESMRVLLSCTLLVLLAGASSAQVVSYKKCPSHPLDTDFDLNQYAGKWYEAKRFFNVFEIGGKCISANYSMNPDGSLLVVNKMVNKLTGVTSSIEGIARQVSAMGEPVFTVTFPSLPIKREGSFEVLGTDYKSYAVVWSCKNMKVGSKQYAWILTREQNPPSKVILQAQLLAEEYGIKPIHFIKSDQTNCPAES